MCEYIEREAISEEIRKYYYKNPPNSSYGEGFDRGLDRAQRAILDAPAADVAPVQKWISVKDRSPETGGYVICIAKRNPFSRFMPMVAKIEKNGWVNPITEQYISDVSHWMPIPEPPKEK